MDRTSIYSRSQSNIPLPSPLPRVMAPYMPNVTGIGDAAPITPSTTVQRLPSIVTPMAANIASPQCDPFSQWVNDNPLWAVGGLAVVAYFSIFHRGRK